ncbi:MAG: 50S ribosomal protein L31 type B [Chlamydiae bacterium]|nr:50S ribosomal protein L31 type B [Chlamydiota bacterium]
MKKNLHPNYRDVLFVDSSTGFKLVCGSALETKKTETFEGKEYPVCHVSVSSSSHPFFTGSNKFIDTEGRVDKFLKKYAKKQQEQPVEEKKEEKPKTKRIKKKKK